MTLAPGTRLAHYEIVEPIGKGGMGEVFRARDTKLKRDVAIKVLPAEFATNEERMKRFAREAELLASLNHPNIAAIYGLEDRALVLELVDGPTLADRIAQGPIPLEEAIAIARQIAIALEAAHEQGIIHRDLKPANVKVREDGTVKILDFGLAKALDDQSDEDASESPTMTAGATRAGVIMGTAAYMSPEQARGKRVDRRADIWAFGVVFYEMLTGKRAFRADDVSMTLAEVMKSEPRWEALSNRVPPTLRVFLERCLVKDPKDRLRDIGDMRLALSGSFEASAANEAPVTRQRRLPWVGAIAAAAVVAGVAVRALTPREVPPVVRFTVSGARVSSNSNFRDIVVAPNGEWLLDGNRGGFRVRRIDGFETKLLRVIGAPGGPFVSPDGAWIGFRRALSLQIMPIDGGPVTTVCEFSGGYRGASWGDDGNIVFSIAQDGGLFVVPSEGGEPRRLTEPDSENGVVHAWPEVLPESDAVLFVVERDSRVEDSAIAVLSIDSGEHRVLIRGGTSPRYLATGHILYVVDDQLLRVPFDAKRLETTGDPVSVLSGVVPKFTGAANFDVSRNGVLVYIRGEPSEGNRSLVWVDRHGVEQPLGIEPRAFESVVLSPDGDRFLSMVTAPDGAADVWIGDLRQTSWTRLTFDPGQELDPIWSPDGDRALFRVIGDGGGLFSKSADGTGSSVRILPVGFSPFSVSSDGERIVGALAEGATWDISEVSLGPEPVLYPLVKGAETEWYPQISPSGNYLAYHMRGGAGIPNIYVRPYPDVDSGLWQLSTNGGEDAMWSPNEDELFYREGPRIVSVPISTNDGFTYGASTVLFEGDYLQSSRRNYDVADDGRFLMIKADATERRVIHVVLNWFSELEP